ncbi:hypothetical protein KAFR_0B00163 [Kazachstania africana CBS 2517]|uniref:Uncharacterized protein n=1 Tax=Kazachstania africana (strain ATCC 22294 / BCRC 22015 / CBS 2517 / CECT 1963 / NBRC 1671 / NRRL Y-8276) TaxID=1071382 RepID=H2APL6_KAZAF|nr:hypothetical protein KAFR_0B00163 [Kazachstania africana CBS 2517]CCF56316.1 hypothetical protein KAFR_0B00163 [Kazachstania africana CBS 2517]
MNGKDENEEWHYQIDAINRKLPRYSIIFPKRSLGFISSFVYYSFFEYYSTFSSYSNCCTNTAYDPLEIQNILLLVCVRFELKRITSQRTSPFCNQIITSQRLLLAVYLLQILILSFCFINITGNALRKQ